MRVGDFFDGVPLLFQPTPAGEGGRCHRVGRAAVAQLAVSTHARR